MTATAEGTTFASGTASDPAMAKHDMTLTLRIWRQKSPRDKGRMVTYQVEDISPDMSFLEMLDVLNEKLILAGDDPVVFDHDCREGICGSCGLMINGTAHGRGTSGGPTTTCQLHMRKFKDGDTIDIEPWRSGGFPVVKDLVVDRSAFDRIISAGGFISAPTGTAPDAHATDASGRAFGFNIAAGRTTIKTVYPDGRIGTARVRIEAGAITIASTLPQQSHCSR